MIDKKSVVILIFNDKGDLSLQLRSAQDDSFALHWDFSCAGGIESKEDYNDAAARELKEELGIQIDICFIERTFFEGEYSQGKTGLEDLYVFKALYNGPFKINPKEVEKIEFVSLKDIDRMINSSVKFHPEFLSLWEKGIILKASQL